ncbi:hypothetical protein EPD60_09875 [Flaviaesturariibacter flavus]|uniref:Uncharacterized protein n=1 Tax=Flaviaesturariibacter flavus TaxID=2502780 RepID=A0A4R1BBD7_9BACT|nr:hypothetical protein [Flaviaesturariibacter flavus]TCJ14299.1 hypothetical protein EPD60_09875 [Flaviaesturariibacter flavus]
MNTFRFVLYTWGCSVLLYPFSVMCSDIFTRSNTELHLFLPLLSGAFVLGLPGLLTGTISLQRLLQPGRRPHLVKYLLWCAIVLATAALPLWMLARPTLTATGEDSRFVVPLFIDMILVLLLRYPYYRHLPITQY